MRALGTLRCCEGSAVSRHDFTVIWPGAAEHRHAHARARVPALTDVWGKIKPSAKPVSVLIHSSTYKHTHAHTRKHLGTNAHTWKHVGTHDRTHGPLPYTHTHTHTRDKCGGQGGRTGLEEAPEPPPEPHHSQRLLHTQPTLIFLAGASRLPPTPFIPFAPRLGLG